MVLGGLLIASTWSGCSDDRDARSGRPQDSVRTTQGTTEPNATEDAPEPTLIALVRDDGWLVTYDVTTGRGRELLNGGRPDRRDPETGMVAGYIEDVELSADGKWVYFSTCCEPVAGNTYRVEVMHPDPETLSHPIAVGSYPHLSPDGRYLATAAADTLLVTDLAAEGVVSSAPMGSTMGVLDPAWSPDGKRIAAVIIDYETLSRQVAVVEVTDDGLVPVTPAEPPAVGAHVGWSPEGNLIAFEGDPYDGSRRVRQDSTYQWQLVVGEVLRLVWRTHIQRGEPSLMEDLPPAIAADW